MQGKNQKKKKKHSQNGISSISSLKLQRKIIGKSLEKKTRAKKCVKKATWRKKQVLKIDQNVSRLKTEA